MGTLPNPLLPLILAWGVEGENWVLSKKESEEFAYHLKKLLQESLIAYNKPERSYIITPLGKLVCDFVEEIEKR